MIQAIVLHKKGNYKRLNAIVQRLSETLSVNRITIIMDESSDLLESSLHQKGLYLKPLSYTSIKPLSTMEMSLCHKHYIAMKNVVARNEHSIILEDDVIFEPRILDEYLSLLNDVQFNYDFIFFGTGCNLSIPGKGFVRSNPPLSKCTDSIVISPRGASKYLDSLSTEGIHLPIDFDMNYRFAKHSLEVYWYEPGITVQGSQDGTYKSIVQASSISFSAIFNLLFSPKRLFKLASRKIANLCNL